MQHDSLFGHFASRSGQPENFATEALNYILNRSSTAKSAFLRFVAQSGAELPTDLMFRTQAAGDDKAIPDLIGMDLDSRQVLLVEAKFWAGLTSNQPITYLKRLPSDTDGLLLFVAPALRFDTLWAELLWRCRKEGFAVEHSRTVVSEEFRAINIGRTQVLALTSWRAVLAQVLRELETRREHDAASDVRQLQGLCERMDSGAFLPLRSAELTSDTGTRIMQYCEIVNEAIEQAKAAGMASTRGLRPTRGPGFYGRYFALYGHVCNLQFNAAFWGRLRAPPIWLGIHELRDKPWSKDALESLGREQPSRLLSARRDHLAVPINLSIGIEKQDVLSDVLRQMKEVGELLRDYERQDQPEPDPAT